MTLAIAAILLGEIALVLDLGNRLFGSYARSLTRASWRILLIVAAAAFMAVPLGLLLVAPESTISRSLSLGFGVVGALVFLHFLFPYRWGIRRIGRGDNSEACDSVVGGIVRRDAVIEVPSLSARVKQLTFIVMSDLHCNNERDLAVVKRCCEVAAKERPDCVLVLGDLGERRAMLPKTIEALASVPARFGTFCVRGNHDCEAGRDEVIRGLLEDKGIALLSNKACRIEELGVTLVGLETPWIHQPLPPCTGGGLGIALTHTPDNIALFGRLGVSVGVAGHTHGGRLRLPLIGPLLVPSRYGRFLDKGLFACKGAFLYVTSGLGYFPGSQGHRGEVLRLIVKRTGPQNH